MTGAERLVARAHERGSTATTAAGARRWLFAHLPGAGWPVRSGWYTARYTQDTRATRSTYYATQHRARMDARYARIGQEWLTELGLAPIDPRREQARANRAARTVALATARNSDEERELIAEGYTLVRDGSHRVLAGMDDGSPFHVEVPLRCQTVGEALDWLRPDGVDEDTPRQGEWYFVRGDPEPEGDQRTEAGSWRSVTHASVATFDRAGRHMPAECLLVEARGETCFLGRRAVKSHAWTARPRLYVRGPITHPEHGTLTLADGWHEVVPNRAHGPFEVGSVAGGMD